MAIFKEALDDFLSNKDDSFTKYKPKRGGEKYNISYYFLKTIKNNATTEDIKLLSYEEALDIYFQYFWLDTGYYNLHSQKLANLLFKTSLELTTKIVDNLLLKTIMQLLKQKVLSSESLIDLCNTLYSYGNNYLDDLIVAVYQKEEISYTQQITKY